MRSISWAVLCYILATLPRESAGEHSPFSIPSQDQQSLDDNWAVIVSSSRFWLNYRHTTNALGIYTSIKRYVVQNKN